jgi:hypothetical protein
MKRRKAALIAVLALLVFIPPTRAQETTQPARIGKQTGTLPDSNAQNIQAYVELLRSDVRQLKTQMMGSLMELSAADATECWPIYSEYDAELTQLNDLG